MGELAHPQMVAI